MKKSLPNRVSLQKFPHRLPGGKGSSAGMCCMIALPGRFSA